MATHDLRQLLVDLGYHVVDRTDTWCECFVASEDENWRGKGLTAEAALSDVVAQMLPSALGRTLLERHAPAHGAAHGTAHGGAPRMPTMMPPTPVVVTPTAPVGQAAPVAQAAAVSPTVSSPTASSTPAKESAQVSYVVRAATTAPVSGRTPPHQMVVALPHRGMIALADGGKATLAGGTAARMAIQTLAQVLESTASLTPLRMRGLPALLGAIQRANREIHEAAKKDSKLKAMQASVAAVLTAGGQVAIVRVGPATVHRLRDGAVEKLLDSVEGKGGERLGADRLVDVETTIQPAQTGDVFVVSPCAQGGQALGTPELMALLDSPDLDTALGALKPPDQGSWAAAVLRIEGQMEPPPPSVASVR